MVEIHQRTAVNAHRPQRLIQEVKILLRLDHPNVGKLLGTAFVQGGEQAMVMQWHKNGTVAAFVQGRSVGSRLRLVC